MGEREFVVEMYAEMEKEIKRGGRAVERKLRELHAERDARLAEIDKKAKVGA